jgi:hypothetical protein
MHRRRSSIHPGGGVHEFQFFDSGSADRGERRLTALPLTDQSVPRQSGPGESPRPVSGRGHRFRVCFCFGRGNAAIRDNGPQPHVERLTE